MQFVINASVAIAAIRTAINGMNDHGRVIEVGANVVDLFGTPALTDYEATRTAIGACKAVARYVDPPGIFATVVP
ncbi:hypothetical protein [Rhizobium oryzicola]|uniref:Uncharacterized protein n=1 Tax=Rhizobium oryzicola TaxID=1232668 RepID=A0ABT8SYL6_9HYPH|nr:hypothetical protein [Rhizobium oryzicola]MDO1583451.1 hypothetical protein [Rhizobium oryzicola]